MPMSALRGSPGPSKSEPSPCLILNLYCNKCYLFPKKPESDPLFGKETAPACRFRMMHMISHCTPSRSDRLALKKRDFGTGERKFWDGAGCQPDGSRSRRLARVGPTCCT